MVSRGRAWAHIVPRVPHHEQTVARAFTAQAESFNRSAVANSEPLLEAIAAQAAPGPGEAWLEAACGPGVVSRHLAPLTGSVHGVDLTPAMIDLARRSAADAGIANATFEVADATATGLEDDRFDGAVTRFSLHHLPVPGRLLEELARVVRPGGRIVVVDLLADEDGEARAWSQEIERLRDPSHWASLTPQGLRLIGERAGVGLAAETVLGVELDFDDWLARGTNDPDAHRLVERVLADPPPAASRFRVSRREAERVLALEVWIGVYRRGS